MKQLEARELRIGNYVTLDDKQRKELFEFEILAREEYFKVTVIGEDGIINLMLDEEEGQFNVFDISPIPLNEEWLGKAGCEKHGDCCYKIPNTDYEFDFRHQRIIHFDGGLFDGGLKVKADFVHEFQNVVFALTGEELTLKEPTKE